MLLLQSRVARCCTGLGAQLRSLVSHAGEQTIAIDRSGLMTVEDHEHEHSSTAGGNQDLVSHLQALIRVWVPPFLDPARASGWRASLKPTVASCWFAGLEVCA